MKIGDIISFKKELYFEGAVQADWFYAPAKSAKVAENFVFHGKDYFGVDRKTKNIDTISLAQILSHKLTDETANPLSLAIADYGTGKSHFAVTLAQLFSGSAYMPETYHTIIDNIRKIDDVSAKEIESASSDRNFVLVINGMRDFNLHYEILRATQKSFKLYGLSDEKLHALNRTLETANLFFERNCESQLSLFEKSAFKHGWTESGSELIAKIRAQILTDDTAFDVINTVYTQITGREISWDEGISARSILEMLLKECCGINGQFDHVIILFDEFGRYLEYASGADSGKSGDSALQQIFEVSQDAGGALQIINFIQSDIKTYLVRVDQTRNISRYIGRYDQSDKYHVSSNLETVFANLIERSNKDAFVRTIVKWQADTEEHWKTIYSLMNKWLSLTGVWGDYELFRKIIIEGIYPMHPISTFMLTQLADYLQNRSSMMLLSQYITEIADKDSSDGIPLVLPEELIRGDLYQEMLASETSGKQLSQHCIRFDNIIRKYGDKLSKASIAVLRANLIARILKFRTKDYEDAKAALMLCSGFSSEDLDRELQLLENEYAILGFDEHAGCFDFMEDSRGAHEYKIQKKRIAASWKSDFRTMFKTAKVLELGELSEPQETSFGTTHKILTNEWKFTQEILLAEDLTKDLAYEYVAYWRTCKSAAMPKGRLIWVYINKDTSLEYVDRLRKIAGIFEGTPIVILLLNDTDGRLANALTNYDILDRMPDSIRQTYERAYSDDFSQAEQILSNEFDSLRKRRERMGNDGVTTMKKRLQVSLTEIFEQLYPQTVSFNFDGLLTASNNFTGKGSTYFCQIVKMLLSNNVSYDTIHDFTSDVRSKITAVLLEGSATSWRCISNVCSIMPPAEAKAKAVYEDVAAQLNAERYYDCEAFFEKFCYPPYGLSEEASIMMLSVILANYSYCVRIAYHDIQNSIIRWKDEIIVKDKKINLPLLKESRFVLIDTEAVEAKFQQLFNRLNNTTDIDEVLRLKFETEKYEADNGVPESLAVHFKLARSRFEAAERAKKIWWENTGKVTDELDEAEDRGNVYNALIALEHIDNIPLYDIFNENGFAISEDYKNTLHSLSARARELVNRYFTSWLEGTIHCKSVEAMTQFEKHVKRCREKLDKFGFSMFAKRLAAQGEAELAKKDEIRSRQELLSDGKRFITAVKKISLKNYNDVCDMQVKARDLIDRLAKFEKSLGNDAKQLHTQLDEWIDKLNQSKQQMQTDMMTIWDDLASAQTFEDIESVLMCINTVLGYRIPEKDARDFEDLKNALDTFAVDMNALKAAASDRKQLTSLIEELRQKYSGIETDFDVCAVLEDEICIVTEKIDAEDAAWRTRYLTLGDKSRETIHTWRENTRILPAFLTDETISAVEILRTEADSLISKAMIDDVVFYFDKLNAEEKNRCLNLLTNRQKTSVRQRLFTEQEAALLLDAYLTTVDGTQSWSIAVEKCSEDLRRMAINGGLQIDEVYRNTNGISSQMARMESAFEGRTIVKPATRLFTEMVSLYREDRSKYEELLKEAKSTADLTK